MASPGWTSPSPPSITVGRTNSSFSPRAYAASMASVAVDGAARPPRGRSRRSRARRDPSACRGPSRSSARRPRRSGHPGGPRRGRRSRSATNASAERGGVSRPSSRACTRTPGHALRGGQPGDLDQVPVVGMDAARTDQADEMEAAAGLGRTAACRRASAGRAAKLPSAIAASIRGRSCSTGRPAPRFRWPTSELPIWPGGSPTASSDARRIECGQSRRSAAPDRHRRRGDRVRRRVVADPEAIQDDEDDRSRTPRWRRRHADPARADAVRPARATMPAISSGLSEAPPTRAPSIDGSAMNSSIDADVTLPP